MTPYVGSRLGSSSGRALIDLVHSGVERTRAHQGVAGHEIVEAVAAHRAQHVRRQRRLELEDARRPPRAQHAIGVGVVQVDLVQIRPLAGAALDVVERIADDGERRQPEEVHLQHARLLEAVHVVLRDDDRLIVAGARTLARHSGDRHVVVERPGSDDDAEEIDNVTVRITLRLPEGLKQRVEEAAARSRQSLNTWLVEAA